MFSKFILALFLILLGLRPFLSSMAFPDADVFYSFAFILISLLFLLKNVRPLQKKSVFSPAALFFLIVLLSVVFSKNRTVSLSEFYKYATYVFCFVAVANFQTSAKKLLIRTLWISSTLVSFYALRYLLRDLLDTMTYLKKSHDILQVFGVEYLSRGRAFVPFPTPTALAGYLILLIPLSFFFLSKNKPKEETQSWRSLSLSNILALLATIGISLALLSTQSLGALLSLGVALGSWFSLQRDHTKRRTIFLVLMPFTIAVFLVFCLRRMNNLFFNQISFSFINRLIYWKYAFHNILIHPWTGFGLGNYPPFKSVSPHNSYLQLWVEMGIFGLIAFLILAYRTIRTSFSRTKKTPSLLFSCLWIGSLSFLVHNLLDFTFFYPEISLQWWAIAALLLNQRADNA